jgi:pimeloyl-ACP methyl ester carboxylesterase/ribosomal protein S18 acetylase RimI-like enzyme
MTARPTLVFLPGMSGLGSFWDPVREQLGDWPTVVVDWPGLGGAPADPAIAGYDDLVDLVLGRLERPSVLVGQSMGGFVAALAALRAPELVSHLVLAVTSAGLDMTALGAADWRPDSQWAHPDAPDWVFAAQPDLSDRLPHIAVPTLLLWADADPISPLAVGRRLAELLPHSHLVVYRSDDHWVVHEQAADVARLIDDLATFRPATEDDTDALVELERAANVIALAHVFPPDEFAYPADDVRRRWTEVLADPSVNVMIVDESEGRLDAFVAFDSGHIRHLAVHPDRWGTGLARRAVQYAADRMQKPRLWCLVENHRALGLYAHLGWRPTGRAQRAEFPPYPEEIELARERPN